VPSSTLTILASSDVGFDCPVAICPEVVPSCPQNDVLLYVLMGNCVRMTVEKIPGDVKDWSRSHVSFDNTRHAKVTITRTLQMIRLTAALTCAKMSVVSVKGLKRIIEWGMVMAVIIIDAPNEDRTNIFLLRESPTFFQRYTGAATREKSEITSVISCETATDSDIWHAWNMQMSSFRISSATHMHANDTAIRWVIHLWTLEPEWLAILMMEKITLMRAAHKTEVKATARIQAGRSGEGTQIHTRQTTSEISEDAAHASSHQMRRVQAL
jgi:hypothetical protein